MQRRLLHLFLIINLLHCQLHFYPFYIHRTFHHSKLLCHSVEISDVSPGGIHHVVKQGMTVIGFHLEPVNPPVDNHRAHGISPDQRIRMFLQASFHAGIRPVPTPAAIKTSLSLQISGISSRQGKSIPRSAR